MFNYLFKIIFKILYKILKIISIIVIISIILINLGVVIANVFFDNAANKDACADSGGAWDYEQDECIFAPDDPRTKRANCEKSGGEWNFKKQRCN